MTRSKSLKYKKKRNKKIQPPKSLALTLGATALLILGGGLAFLIFRNNGGSSTLPVGSEILPVDTSSSLTLTTQSNQRDRLQDFNIPQTRQVILEGLNAINQSVLEPHGLSYEADIKSWVGSQMTRATVTPEASDDEILAPTSEVWILPIRDSGRAKNFLSQGLTRGGGRATQAVYQKQEIKTLQTQSNTLQLAMLDRHIVIANDLPSMREIIDTAQSETSLATQDRFQLAMEEVKSSNPLALVYLNIPANTSQIFEQEGRQIDESTLKRLQEFQGLGSSIELTKNGLKFNAISWLDPDTEESLTVTGADQGIIKQLPADTLLMMSGDSFQQVWNDYQEGVETQLLLPFSPKALQKNFTKFTDLNFEKDFFPWMTGNFAAGVIPSQADNAQNAGVVFMVKTRDKTAAEQTMRALESKMQEKYAIQISETKVKDRSVVNWQLPPNLPIASRGWLEDKVLFFTMFAPITERIVEQETSLSEDPQFEAATQALISPKSGQFFFNVPQLAKFMETSQFLPKLTPEYKKYTKEFETIGGTSTTLNDWSTRYEVNVNFVKK